MVNDGAAKSTPRAERSNGYVVPKQQPVQEPEDRPHEFYVKKSGCGER